MRQPSSPVASAGARIGWTSRRLTARRRASPSTSAGRGTASAGTPDNVVVTLDKTNYAAGEEAKLRIASAFAGKATIALVGDKIERFIDVDLVSGDNVVPFPIGGDCGRGPTLSRSRIARLMLARNACPAAQSESHGSLSIAAHTRWTSSSMRRRSCARDNR